MKRRISALLMAVVMCAALAAPVWASGNATPELSITWLSVEGEPTGYNSDFGWVILKTGEVPIGENSYRFVTCLADYHTGERVVDFDYVGGLSEGLYAVGKCVGDTTTAGFVDENLNVVIPLEYTDASAFSDGLACVNTGTLQNPRYGYINKKGEMVIQPEYDRVYPFSEGIAAVAKENEYGKLKWGLIDKKGQIVAPLEYEEIGSIWYGVNFSEDLAPVRKITADGEGKYGFINAKGIVEIPIEFDMADSFSDGLAVVGKKDGNWNIKYGYINKKGEVVIPIEYDSIGGIFPSTPKPGQDLILVNQKDSDGNDRYGYIERNGKIVIPPQYIAAGPFSEDGLAYAAILEGEDDDQTWKYGYIDKTGSVVIPMEYSGARDFYCNAAVVMNWNSNRDAMLYGLIDKTGTVILPLEYDEIQGGDGWFSVRKRDSTGNLTYGVFDDTGKEIIPVQFVSVWSGMYDGLIKVTGNDGVGFYSMNGELVLPLEYDGAGVLGAIGWVQKGTSYGIFENPYWNPPEEELSDSSNTIPVVPIAIGAVLVVGVISSGVLMVRKKGKKTVSGN